MLSGSARAGTDIAIVATARTAAITACPLPGTLLWVRVMSRRGMGTIRGGDGSRVDEFPEIVRRHANELPEFRIAGGIDCDAAGDGEFPDETPRRQRTPENSVTGRTAPGPNDPEVPAPYPVAPHVDDEFFLAARNNERAEHLPAVFETQAQVRLSEGVGQSHAPLAIATPLWRGGITGECEAACLRFCKGYRFSLVEWRSAAVPSR